MRFRLTLPVVLAVLLQATPASAGLIDAFNGTTLGHAPDALGGIMGNGIGLARALFNIVFVTALVVAYVKTALQLKSFDVFTVSVMRVFFALIGPLILFNAIVGLLPNIGQFFLGIAVVLTGKTGSSALITPYAILSEGSSICLALIQESGSLGSKLGTFAFGPGAMLWGIGIGSALIVIGAFIAVSAVLVKNIWGLFLVASIGAINLGWLGAELTFNDGLGFFKAIWSKGFIVVTAIVLVTIVTNEARTWPAFIHNATIVNFYMTAIQVDGSALLCALLTWGMATEVGLAFLVTTSWRALTRVP